MSAVVTAADLPPGWPSRSGSRCADLPLTDYLQPVLAAGVVRYVGEPLAVVVAEDPYAAEDAAELVDIDIDPLPAVLDAAAAAARGAPLLFPAGNVAADFVHGIRGHRGRVRRGRRTWPRPRSRSGGTPRCRWSRGPCSRSPTRAPAA